MNLPYTIEERTNSVPNSKTKTFVDFHTITIRDAKGRTVATLGALAEFSPYSLSLAECREAARAMVEAVNAQEVVA